MHSNLCYIDSTSKKYCCNSNVGANHVCVANATSFLEFVPATCISCMYYENTCMHMYMKYNITVVLMYMSFLNPIIVVMIG